MGGFDSALGDIFKSIGQFFTNPLQPSTPRVPPPLPPAPLIFATEPADVFAQNPAVRARRRETLRMGVSQLLVPTVSAPGQTSGQSVGTPGQVP